MQFANPTVSVCIPVYNGEHYIAESLQSVLGQTFEDLELIVCDNCSTDATADIVRGFGDRRITYVRNRENLGIAGNTNRCLDLARGRYVSIWHHDDVMLPQNLERKVRFLDEHATAGFAHSALLLTDAHGRASGSRWTIDPEPVGDCVIPGLVVFRRYVDHMIRGGMIFIGATLTRRVCYERLGRFRLDLPNCNDSEMWLRLLLYYDVGYLAEPLLKWRQHAGSTTSITRATSLRGPRWIRQHYDAVRFVFLGHGERIPDSEGYFRRVRARFAQETVDQGWTALSRGRARLAWSYVATAPQIDPRILLRRPFWALARRAAGGLLTPGPGPPPATD